MAPKRVVYRGIGPQPRAGSGLQDRLPSACPILGGWVPTATAATFFRASYWNSSLKQALKEDSGLRSLLAILAVLLHVRDQSRADTWLVSQPPDLAMLTPPT